MQKLFSVLILFFPFLLSSCHEDEGYPEYVPITEVDEDDYLAMEALCKTFHLDHPDVYGLMVSPWDLNDPTTWSGVEFEFDFEARVKRVVSLRFEKEGWRFKALPPIPPEIGKLKSLRSIELKFVDCLNSQEIPKELFDCPLVNIELIGDYFGGTIPGEIKNAASTLDIFGIYDSHVDSISPEVAELVNLSDFCVVGSDLKGKVPNYFNDMECGVHFENNHYSEMDWNIILQGKNVPYVAENDIEGVVPEEVVNCPYWNDEVMEKLIPQRNRNLVLPDANK